MKEATDQLIRASETLLREGRCVFLHSDLQRIDQVVCITVDRTSLSVV